MWNQDDLRVTMIGFWLERSEQIITHSAKTFAGLFGANHLPFCLTYLIHGGWKELMSAFRSSLEERKKLYFISTKIPVELSCTEFQLNMHGIKLQVIDLLLISSISFKAHLCLEHPYVCV